MNNHNFMLTGKLLFALAVLSIGIVHLVTNNFPAGLMPVPANVPYRFILIYVDGYALLISGMLILTKKYEFEGLCFSAIIWLILLLALHLPLLIPTYNAPGEWTPTFEVASFLAGALILMANSKYKLNAQFKLITIGRYLFATGLIVFFVLHMIYADYIATLITSWIPFKLFFSYLVGVAFLAGATSIITGLLRRLSSLLLGSMFLIWVLILHLPRVIANLHTEPEWISVFVALGFSGISFVIAATASEKSKVI